MATCSKRTNHTQIEKSKAEKKSEGKKKKHHRESNPGIIAEGGKEEDLHAERTLEQKKSNKPVRSRRRPGGRKVDLAAQ